MSKLVSKVTAMHMGHLRLDFSDGTSEVLFRGNHERLAPKAGDAWPPVAFPKSLRIQKVIAVSVAQDGSHYATLADGSLRKIERGKLVPRVGDEYHEHIVEASDAVDTKASQAAVVERQPVKRRAKKQDEA